MMDILLVDYIQKSSDISWMCIIKTCKAKIRTDADAKTRISGNLDHNHQSDDRKIEQQIRTI